MATEDKTSIQAYVKGHTEILVGYPRRKGAFYSTIVTIKFKKKPEYEIVDGLQTIIDNYAQKNRTFLIEIEDGRDVPTGDRYLSVNCVRSNYKLISDGDAVRIKFKEKGEDESQIVGNICHVLAGSKTIENLVQ
jgi:hypothetical protein